MDSKDVIIEEEKAAYEVPLDSAIHRARLQHETQEGLETEARALYARHSDLFPSYEDAEYFAMLPLSKANRRQVLDTALRFVKEEYESKQSWLAPESDR
jgi:hypothetical protein